MNIAYLPTISFKNFKKTDVKNEVFTGINRYSRNILESLIKNNNNHEMYLLGYDYFGIEGIKEIPGMYLNGESEQRQKEIYMQAYLRDIDIIHSFYPEIPSKRCCKRILTIHDLTPLVNKEWFQDDSSYKFFDENIRQSAITADYIIAISENTKRDIINYYGINEERIKVIYNGLDSNIKLTEISYDYSKVILDKFGIDSEYILSVCTIEPRKNLPMLVKTFERYCQENAHRDIKLVLTGANGWKMEESIQTVHNSKYKNNIIFTGYVSDEELSVLYQEALCFAYISLYEGFGLPVLEAMAKGKCVLTSNVSSLPEVGGDAVCYCNPLDTDSVYSALAKIIEDSKYRKELSEKAKAQASKFSYNKAAQEIWDIYETMLGGR